MNNRYSFFIILFPLHNIFTNIFFTYSHILNMYTIKVFQLQHVIDNMY